MHPPDSHHSDTQTSKDAAAFATTPTYPSPLPWEWFEFHRRATPINAGITATVDNAGAQKVWQVLFDGHAIPFKFLRRQSSSPATRPVLLLLHGMGLTIASFRGVSSYLLQTHDLLLPDYSAFSAATTLSIPAGTPPSFKDLAALIWRLADALNIDQLSLAGSSLGGGLCLTATLLAPQRVQRLLLSNPACFPQYLPRTYRWARVPMLGEFFMTIINPARLVGGVEYIGYVDKSRFDPALRHIYTQSLALRPNRMRLMALIRQLPAGPRDLASALHLPRLSEIRQPVLLTWGAQDLLLDPAAGEKLAAELPNTLFDPHPDLAHLPHEEAPERIGPRWAAFLNLPRH